jgi:hypothetical protein
MNKEVKIKTYQKVLDALVSYPNSAAYVYAKRQLRILKGEIKDVPLDLRLMIEQLKIELN